MGRGAVAGPHDRRAAAARAVDARQRRAGDLHRGPRGSRARPTAACSSTSATCRPTTSAASCPRCTSSSRSWPTSTSRPVRWRSGPTTHYVMGGVRVDAETGATTVPGLFAAGEVAGGMHGANRLGGNSLSDLLVFGPRTGAGAAAYAATRERRRTSTRRRSGRPRGAGARRSSAEAGEDPYRAPAGPPGDDAGAGRASSGSRRTSRRRSAGSAELRERGDASRVRRRRAFNPGWNLVFELRNLLTSPRRSRAARSSGPRAAGAHSRLDYPETDAGVGPRNSVVRPTTAGQMRVTHRSHAGAPGRAARPLAAARTAEGSMPTHTCGSSAVSPAGRRATRHSRCRWRRGWSSSTRSTGSRATPRPTSPSAGTARPRSAARAARRSTAGRA